MLVEQSLLMVKPGMEEAFETAMQDDGLPLLRGLVGVQAVRFGRGVEHPDKFILLIEWASMDDHVAFTTTPQFAEFRRLLAPYTAGGSMEHFRMQ